MVSTAYRFGQGVEQDLKKAYFWALLALRGGLWFSDEMPKRIERLAKKLGAAEVARLEDEASNWLAAQPKRRWYQPWW
jgi:hypothetical protein